MILVGALIATLGGLSIIAQAVGDSPHWDVTLNSFLLVILAVINAFQATRLRSVKKSFDSNPRDTAEEMINVMEDRGVFGRRGIGRRNYDREADGREW